MQPGVIRIRPSLSRCLWVFVIEVQSGFIAMSIQTMLSEYDHETFKLQHVLTL